MILVAVGERVQRKQPHLLFWGRTVMAAGLASLYVTIYAACSLESVRVIHSPALTGVLLLSWSLYVVLLAERKKSQTLSLFAITLAYSSSAINPVNSFTLTADLLLAITAVLPHSQQPGHASLLQPYRNYGILLWRLIIDKNYEVVLDTSRTLHFWPYAIYLLLRMAYFHSGRHPLQIARFSWRQAVAFLSLNNGGWLDCSHSPLTFRAMATARWAGRYWIPGLFSFWLRAWPGLWKSRRRRSWRPMPPRDWRW